MRSAVTTTLAFTFIALGAAQAAEPASCKKVRLSDPGWTDVTAITATASVILEALGYETEAQMLSIDVTYASMKNKDIDVYFGDWQPSTAANRQPYLDDKSIEVVSTNLTGAKYTLAVPRYTAEAGVKDIADLSKFADKFGKKIYGIEPGNDGNRLIGEMIKSGKFGLEGWEVVESSESGMLSQVERAVARQQWIAFLGWAPHPMNARFPMEYLSGGDDYFGPNYGGAEVHTDIRAGYGAECPNVTKFATNLKFTVDIQNELMGKVIEDAKDPKPVARTWLKANENLIGPWLEGVTAYDGGDAKAAVAAALDDD